ncbi:MAG TPA: hypothetical protein VFP35_03685 [Candidatus Saccharimonadales bacterium]|nr:hypothetical protein [Candidatus Saccharimonadales bacterium]
MRSETAVNLKPFYAGANRKLSVALKLIALPLLIIGGVLIALNQSLNAQAIFFSSGFILFMIGWGIGFFSSEKASDKALVKFLKLNGFKAIKTLSEDSVPPSIWEKSAIFKFSYCFSGKLDGYDFVGANITGKYMHWVAPRTAVLGGPMLRIKLNHSWPRIDFTRPGNLFLQFAKSSRVAEKDMTKVSLEGDFSDKFSVEVHKGNELEAEELFTPNFMAKIEDFGKFADFTVVGNQLFIMTSGSYYDKRNLNTLFGSASLLIAQLEK